MYIDFITDAIVLYISLSETPWRWESEIIKQYFWVKTIPLVCSLIVLV